MRLFKRSFAGIASVAALLVSAPAAGAQEPALLTPSEATGWQALSTFDEVTSFYRELQARSPFVRTFHLGWSRENRELLTVTIANPAVNTPAEAHASGKPVVFIAAQVHGDEPAGKEGLMLFARDLALGSLQELLDEVVFVFVPQINPDAGEAGEWGTRTNPSGYNLNRDYILLPNPETRALITNGVVRWSPHVLVDAHEARGPPRYYDFYTLWPRNLHGGQAIVDLTEEEIVPRLVSDLADAGFDHYFYHIVPRGIESDPSIGLNRGGTGARSLSSYGGPAGMITFLFESLRNVDSRIGIYQRAASQWTAMESLGRYVAENPERVIGTVADAHAEMVTRGASWEPSDSIFMRWESYATHEAPYRLWHEDRVVEVEVPIIDGRRPVLGRERPVGYLIEAHRGDVAEQLALHGITVERLLEDVTVDAQSYQVDSVTYGRVSESQLPRRFELTVEPAQVEVPAGSWLVRAGQPKAGLVFHMLEPEDIDSLAAAGWFINEEAPGRRLPYYRLRALPPVATQVAEFGVERRRY